MSNYEVRQYQDTFTLYELTEQSSNSRVVVCPERGGIVIGCQLHGTELFYLDKATFDNAAANIRGGNPILFPICGQLDNQAYEWNGQTHYMANHGVARTSVWEVVDTQNNDEASITIRLRSNEQTLQSYPFAFELLFTYVLKDGQLHTRQQYRNLSESDTMPFYAGFHPYFALDSNKNIAYESDATRYIDYNDNVEKPFTGMIDLEGLVESVCLLDAKKSEIAFPVSADTRVRLTYDDIFKYVVLWSVKDRPFLCVEPWMAMTGELNRQDELIMLGAGEELKANFTISCEQV
ncbi:galactose mutarotase-like enzyme [Paenibacillus castaneae]|uniref:aldose epimerase family protein n=1 Tax=Paenibacillus castaneae TaxID=474957 RepID=UPI000C9C5E1A|nr:aldose epimerase [Paenibacillus castaneae]NIK78150.1 galactose mutarotase-like enzyme [Paenibacillus castaneae]